MFFSDLYMYSVQIQHLFLELVGVLQNTLGLQSPTGLLKSPCLYAIAIVNNPTMNESTCADALGSGKIVLTKCQA